MSIDNILAFDHTYEDDRLSIDVDDDVDNTAFKKTSKQRSKSYTESINLQTRDLLYDQTDIYSNKMISQESFSISFGPKKRQSTRKIQNERWSFSDYFDFIQKE